MMASETQARSSARGCDPLGNQPTLSYLAQHPSKPPGGLLAPSRVRKAPGKQRFRHAVARRVREAPNPPRCYCFSVEVFAERCPYCILRRHTVKSVILPCRDLVDIGHRSRRLDVLLREDHCRCIHTVELFDWSDDESHGQLSLRKNILWYKPTRESIYLVVEICMAFFFNDQ